MGAQCVAAGENAQVLEHDRFEQRRHQLVGRGAYFLQAVDVGLGEYAALPCYLVELDAMIFLLGKQIGGNFQLGVNFVDHRAGAAGALVVHGRNFLFAAGFFVVFEDDDLGVLPTELDDGINLRMKLLHSQRNSGHFLDELRADLFGDRASPRAGHEHTRVVRIDAGIGFHALQKFQRFFGLLGLMTLIVLPKHLIAGRLDDHGFYRRRTDVESDQELERAVVAVHGMAHWLPASNGRKFGFEWRDLN